jgi:hypothetical protein
MANAYIYRKKCLDKAIMSFKTAQNKKRRQDIVLIYYKNLYILHRFENLENSAKLCCNTCKHRKKAANM